MKRFSSLFLCVCFVVFLSSGCDLLRGIAGLPTAEEVEKMAEAIEKKKAETSDTLAVQSEQVPDSVSVVAEAVEAAPEAVTPVQVKTAEAAPVKAAAGPVASFDSFGYNVMAYSPQKHKYTKAPEKGYYLMIGYFNSKENAENLVANAKKDGFEALILQNTNGASSVALVHTATSGEMAQVLKKASTLSYVPKSAWILECK